MKTKGNNEKNRRLNEQVGHLMVRGQFRRALELLDKLIEDPLPLFQGEDWVIEERRLAWLYRTELLREWGRMTEALALSSRALGSEAFRREAEARMRTARDRVPNRQRWVDISRRRVESGPSEAEVTAAVAAEYRVDAAVLRQRGNREAKDAWIRLLLDECGLEAREVGFRLGHMDGGTVGRRARAFAAACRDDEAIRSRFHRVIARITNAKA